LKRIGKVLERDFPGRVAYRTFRSPEEVDRACADVEAVAAKTYQRGIGAGFANNEENRKRFRLCAEKGWLRVYALYIDDQPRAFWSGTLYRGIFHLDFTGFDPELRKYEPGTAVFLKMIEDLCASGVTLVDFGLGTAPYKERFGDTSWEEISPWVFAPGFRGNTLGLLVGASNVLNRATKSFLQKTDLANRIKRLWRGKLAAKAPQAEAPSSSHNCDG
jgi:CelD/BcsL family acetyltransferase involved in cellulose biosynthesis